MNLNSIKYILNRFLLGRKSLLAKTHHFGLKLHVKAEDVVGRHLYKYGSHEPALTIFLREYLKFEDGDVALDIGANIGWYSLLLDKIAGDKQVDIFAFEPDPTNFDLLKRNIQQNSCEHVHPVQRAVADVEDILKLHLYNKTNLGRHSMLAIHEGKTIDVKTIILDKYWKSQNLADRVPRFSK